MNSTLEYMIEAYPRLSVDYRAPNSVLKDSCGLVAIEIAQRLLAENKSPYIILIEEKNREEITPRIAKSDISWYSHQVCCEGNLAYDPMIDFNPVKLKDYCKKAFFEDVEIKNIISKDIIKEFVER